MNKAGHKISKRIEIKGKSQKGNALNEMRLKNGLTANKLYIYIIIILFSFILYGNTISNNYALDDATVITENKFTQKGIEGIRDIFAYDSYKGFKESYVNQVSGGRYRPLSIAAFAIEYQFLGKNPHFSHFINVLLYSLTCLLIFILLSRLLKKYPSKKWYFSIPFIATILFIAHPVHTEVVANIKGRDEIFSLLFSLMTLWFLIKYIDMGGKKNLIYSCILYFLALISKENAIVFIAIFPLIFYFFSNHSTKKILSSIAPLFAPVLLFIIVRQMSISRTSTDVMYAKDIMNYSFAEMNVRQKYATIIYTLGLYIKLLFFPHPLTWDYYPYHIPVMEWSNITVILSLLVYFVLIYFAFKGLKPKNFYSFCIFLFLIPLSLTSNILFSIGAFMSERFLYVASLGFSLLIAYLVVVRPNRYLKMLFGNPYLFLIPALLLLSLKTISRNKDWKDNATLLETDVKTSANSFKSNAFFGNNLYERADSIIDPDEKAKIYELALSYCEKANKIYPDMANTNFVLGTIYGKYKNDLDKSVYYLKKTLNLDPNNIEAYNNLGIAYGIAKQYDKAVDIFEKALKIAPGDPKVLSNLVAAYNFTGNSEKAAMYSKELKEIQGKEKNTSKL